MTVRQNLGELINEVRYRRDRIVITKAGKPIPVLLGMNLYERIQTCLAFLGGSLYRS